MKRLFLAASLLTMMPTVAKESKKPLWLLSLFSKKVESVWDYPMSTKALICAGSALSAGLLTATAFVAQTYLKGYLKR